VFVSCRIAGERPSPLEPQLLLLGPTWAALNSSHSAY